MASVFDVAAYIIHEQGPVSAMKLHKLLYYSQAWSLVWDERPIFRSRIEAWANGPVVRNFYGKHRGRFKISKRDAFLGDPGKLNEVETETVDLVLAHYGDKPPQWLSDLTHLEPPWRDARQGLAPGERGDREIGHAAMSEYYGGL